MKDKEAGRGFDYPALARGLSQWYLSLDERFHVVEVHAPGDDFPYNDPTGAPVWQMLVAAADWDPRVEDLRRALEGGQEVRDFRYQHSSVGSVPREKIYELSCVVQPEDSELSYLCVVTDVTERARAERDQLRNAARIEALLGDEPAPAWQSVEAHLQDYLRASSDWFWEMDEQLRFTYISEQVERLTHAARETALGLTRRDLLGSDYDREQWDDHLKTLAAHKPFQGFTYLMNPDVHGYEGRWIWVSISGVPVFDEHGEFRGYRGIGRDVTAAHEAEKAAGEARRRTEREAAQLKSERFLRSVLDGSQDLVAVVDTSGRISFINHAASSGLGFEAEDIIGLRPYDATHRDDKDAFIAALARTSEQAGSAEVEHRVRNSDGEWRVMHTLIRQVDSDDGPQLVLSSRDVTERRKAEEELSDREEHLRTTLNSIGDAVIATDTQGRVVRMNPVAERLTGWHFTEARGKDLSEVFQIVHAISRRPEANPVSKVLASGEIVGLANHTVLLSRNGSEHMIADSGSPIRNEAGETLGVVLVFRDVTDEYALQEQVRQSQKMDAIGQLAGGVAHDFNNMLAGIMGAAELLEKSLPDDPQARTFHRIIVESAQNAAGLTGKLLAFARKQAPVFRSIDVHDAVRQTVALLERTIDRRIEVVVDLAAEDSTLLGDPSQLQSVFLNLCINACQAMPEGGTLQIASKMVELDRADCRATTFDLQPGPHLELDIRDTGRGIPPEHLGRIFEPFFTTKEPGQGTGLGLATVFGTIQQHKGAISVYSEVEQGTRFQILLALVDADERADHDSLDAVSGTGCVLVVDDEAVVRTTAEAMLRQLGYDVLVAEDGQAALEIFSAKHAEIDAVLLDMIMPRMNGKDCFKALQKVDPAVRVVLASGFSKDDDVAELRLAGLLGFIEKPYRSAALGRVIRDALDSPEDT